MMLGGILPYCVMPFVENYTLLKPLLHSEMDGSFVSKINEAAYENAKNIVQDSEKNPALQMLSDTEYQICQLIAEHQSNRDIAQKLFLSEGTVRQYINKIYTKLELDGDGLEKRRQLSTLLSPKTNNRVISFRFFLLYNRAV